MAQSQTFQINFSHDELIYLLNILRLPPMMGMRNQYYPDSLDKETIKIRLQVAAQALEARNLLRLDREQIELDTSIAGMLTIPTVAREIMALTTVNHQTNEVASTFAYHTDVTLVHTIQKTQLHTFYLAESTDIITPALMDMLPLSSSQKLDINLQDIPLDALETITAVIENPNLSIQDQMDTIISQGIDTQLALLVTDMLDARQATSILISLLEDNTDANESSQYTMANTQIYYHFADGTIELRYNDETANLVSVSLAEIEEEFDRLIG